MAISIACKTCVCSRPTSTNSPKATKETTKPGTMSMNNKSRNVASRGLFSTVRKKLRRSKLPHKNIIIIHNNTSITSNEEDNRSSCVEAKDIAAMNGGKDQTKPLPASSPPSKKEKSSTTDRKSNNVVGVVVDGSPPASSNDRPASTVDISNNISEVGGETRAASATADIEPADSNSRNKEEKGQKKTDIKAAQRQLEAAQKELEAAQRELEAATREKASIRIQATFRGHLSRRAFRALKSLVKLQAVVRGASVRRQQRMALHCMHAMVRLQVRVRARQFLSTKSISEEEST